MACSARAMAAAALCFGLVSLGEAAALRSRSRASRLHLDTYSFEQFAKDFGRDLPAQGSGEYKRRAALFQTSLVEIRAVKARNTQQGRLWKAGVHPFMDWTQAERQSLNGYKPTARRGAHAAPRGSVSLLHSSARAFNRNSANATRWETAFSDSFSTQQGGLSADMGPPIRNQGDCGSCWAISAAEAVEAQLQRSGLASPGGVRVSAQALVDCVPNPQHCGGSGGCDGATGELAYSFMRDYGIPLESELPYTAQTQQCPHQLNGPWHASPRVRVGGWNQLPSNKAEPLMQALTQQGPVVVAVDGNNWFNYESGIFDGCDKNAILGHAVLAKGYGEESGNKYWLIQNSWGADWGEQGHIRLMRHQDEDSWCGIDNKPKEGLGCDGGPAEITVCGTCGVLYDPIVPTGVHLEDADSTKVQHDSAPDPVPVTDADLPQSPQQPQQPAADSQEDANMVDKMRRALQ